MLARAAQLSAHRVLVIGHINLDIHLRLNRIPKIDECAEALDAYTSIGGSATNFSVALTRFGVKPILYAFVGSDLLSSSILKTLRGEGVIVDFVQRASSTVGIVVVLVHSDGSKRMVVASGANRELTLRYLPHYVLLDASHVHVATRKENVFRQINELAELYGKKFSVMLTTQTASLGLKYFVRLSRLNMMFMNLAEAHRLTGLRDLKDVVNKLKDVEDIEFVITLGKLGALSVHSGEVLRADAPLVSAVDTTGAGDAFAAAYVASKLMNFSRQERLLIASTYAALKVTRRGSSSMPTIDELISFLALRDRGLSERARMIFGR